MKASEGGENLIETLLGSFLAQVRGREPQNAPEKGIFQLGNLAYGAAQGGRTFLRPPNCKRTFMSDQPDPPRDSKKPSTEPNSNWRVFLLFGLAVTIIVLAFTMSNDGKVNKVAWPKFQELLRNDQVVMGDDKRPLKVIESGGPAGSVINGYYLEKAPEGKWTEGENFQVPVSLSVTRESLADLVGDLAKYEEGTQTNGVEMSYKDFKSLLWKNAVVLDGGPESLKIVTTPGSDQAVLVGRSKTLAKATPAEGDKVPETGRFKVEVPNYMYKELEHLYRNGAVLEKDSGVWQSVLLSFLPILILLLLLFFLFRHQMKSAGRGCDELW